MSNRSPLYVIHTCKNKVCNNAWLDVDRYNAQDIPPKWRYCADCKKKGFLEQKNLQSLKNLAKAEAANLKSRLPPDAPRKAKTPV